MDWEYIRIWSGVLALVALGATLLWALGFALFLHRRGSQGWASTRRLLASSLVVFGVALAAAVAIKEGPSLWNLARGRLGSAEGQVQTGILYQTGEGFLRRNPVKAVAAFRRAAQQGYAPAQMALAQACRLGWGTAQNLGEALHWAQAAAQAGQPLAMVQAGELLQASAPAEADIWFRKAAPLLQAQAGQGDAQACFALGSLNRQGQGVPQDPVAAFSWFLRAQHLGLSPLQGFAVQSYGRDLTPGQQAQAHTQADAWSETKRRTQGK